MQAEVLVSTLDLKHEEWLQERQKGIGGSDAAAIAGLNPWRSPIAVYLDKTGRAEPMMDNERMRIGRDLEDYVAKRFVEATGLSVRRRNAILQHKEHDFMIANVDRLIVGKKEGLECKTTNSYAKKDWEDGVPIQYEIQCHHYMAVTGYNAWWIACLIGNEAFVYKKIERDQEVIDYLIQIEKDFWHNYVLKKEMPAPDGSKNSGDLLKMIYPEATPNTSIDLQNDFTKDLERRDDIQTLIKKLETEKAQIEQTIQAEMKDFEMATVGERLITWKTINSNRFDTKTFKKDYPDLYSQYAKQNAYRRFVVK